MADLTATIPVSVSVTPTPPTPGYKTSEAWLTLLAIVVGSLTTSGVLVGAPPVALQIAGIAGSVLAALGYTYNRSQLKMAHAVAPMAAAVADEARKPQSGRVRFDVLGVLASLAGGFLVTIVMIHMLGCTHAQVVAGENAAEACGISDGKSLLSSIASDLAAGGLAAAEAAIGSDKALAGLAGDAINCLVSVVVAVESAGTGSAIATSEAVPSRSALIVANGNAYLAKHGGK